MKTLILTESQLKKIVKKIMLEQNEFSNQIKWFRDYINSPKYIERLKKEFPGKDQKFIENERNIRLQNLNSAEFKTSFVKAIGSSPGAISGMYYPKKNEGFYWDNMKKKWVIDTPNSNRGSVKFEREYNPKTWDPYPGYETIPTHEYGHAVDDGGTRIPQSTKEKIHRYTGGGNVNDKYGSRPNYKSSTGNLEFDYISTPTEFINRIQPLRYLLQKEKIYDAKTKNFTEQDFHKMINNTKITSDHFFEDIWKTLKGSETQKKRNFINLMNTVAMNNSNTSNNVA
jgi:hypothetical protein